MFFMMTSKLRHGFLGGPHICFLGNVDEDEH